MVGNGKYIGFMASFCDNMASVFSRQRFIAYLLFSMVFDVSGVLPKGADLVISPIVGMLEHAEVTDEGMRFIAKTKGGYYVSVDVTETEMIVSLHGLIIMIRGEYVERADGHYQIYDKLENTYAKLDVGPEDQFRLVYEINA